MARMDPSCTAELGQLTEQKTPSNTLGDGTCRRLAIVFTVPGYPFLPSYTTPSMSRPSPGRGSRWRRWGWGRRRGHCSRGWRGPGSTVGGTVGGTGATSARLAPGPRGRVDGHDSVAPFTFAFKPRPSGGTSTSWCSSRAASTGTRGRAGHTSRPAPVRMSSSGTCPS